jgi:MFS family permease
MFGIPASCLWGLLPLVAHDRLHTSTFEFGVLSGAIGVGAVLGTVALMPLRARMSWNHFVALCSAAYAVVLAGMALIPWYTVMFALLVVVGAAWVGVQSTWMIATHAVMPSWIKARVIAFIMLVFQGSQAVGSVLWGVLADLIGLVPSILLSALVMALSAIGMIRRGIMPSDHIAPDLAESPGPVAAPPGHEGKWVIIETTYRVVPGCAPEFFAAMSELRLSRLRLGARRWTLAAPVDSSDSFVEYCMFKDWAEYRSQETERLTVPEYRLRTLLTDYLVTEPRTRVLVEPKNP